MYARLMIFAFGLVFALSVLAEPALAQKRFALLIGNQNYAAEVGRLKNPINDINLIARSLRKMGFSADNSNIVKNGNRRAILQAIDAHSAALKAAGEDAIGFLYYSGHGAANKRNRRNYLIPVGVQRLDASVWYDAIPLDSIVSTLADLAGNAAHFVIFDACRNLLNMPTKGSKGFEPTTSKRGMLIAFSTDPGETASDEGNGSGPYAAALAEQLVKPGLDHLDLFQNVKEAVIRKTKVQVPWERNGLLRRVYLAGQSKPQVPNNARISSPDVGEAATVWQTVKHSKNPAVLQQFAEYYQGTFFSKLARTKLAGLDLSSTNAPSSHQPFRPLPATNGRKQINVAFFLEWATPNQVAKVKKTYERRLGIKVNWVDFQTGVAMTEAMRSGQIDIAYSQGLAPFVVGVQRGAPLKMVAIAVVYEANDCFIKNGLAINSSNASELEGKTVAVPLNTLAEVAFRNYMKHLKVDVSKLKILDQVPPDGAKSLADGRVHMACIFGGASTKAASEVGKPIMSKLQKIAAGIGAFDVISTTEKFSMKHPELLRAFLKTTEQANRAWKGTREEIEIVAKDAGMSADVTKKQMASFVFPSITEQLEKYFNKGGIVMEAAEILGVDWKAKDASKIIDSSFLK